MSYNFLDKSGLTYFWNKIKGMFLKLSGGTMTGQLKTSFKSSVATGCYGATATTISNLCTELRYSSGCMGSFSLNTAYTYGGVTISTGWYNFLWVPHRSGGVNGEASGDNCDYGALMLWGMNNANGMFRIRYSNGSVQECRRITDNSIISSYIANSNSYINTHPENSPVLIPFIHNDIAFLLKRGGSAKIYYDNVEQTLDISNVFDGSPSYWAINPTGTTEIIIELTLHQVFAWTNTIYCDFGSGGWRSKSVKIEVMNTNYASDVWTSKLNTTTNGSGNIKTTFNHTPVGAGNAGGGFNKIRFTFSDWATASIFRISQLGVYNYGSQGVRQTYMSRGIDDYVFRNITPNNNNTFNLGSSSNKWANVYATTFQGNATSATKATQDSDGNAINTTYYKASNPNGYTSNTGTITGITMNGASKGTSGVVNLGTVITAHQDISGKVDVANIDITGQTTTLLALTKALGTNGIHYARWYSKTDGGSSGISDKPSGSTNAGFVCEAICSRYNNATDYRYTLICWTQSRKAPYTASIEYSTTSLSWTALPLTDTTYSSKTAASGGTDVSLVTTGEKYTWNNKTSNTGTVTSVKIEATSPIAIDNNAAITSSGTRAISHSNSGVTAGKYRQVMVNATGHVTAGENPTTLSGYGITDAKIENGVITLGSNTIKPVTDISGKQDKLTTQTAYASKGSATKVPQITTNTLGQVTGITEVTITQPTVNNGTLTIQKNGTNVQTFSANQSGNATANIVVPTKTTDLTNDSGFIESEDETVANIVSLTKAEYDALTTKTPNTLYNITDDYEESVPDVYSSAETLTNKVWIDGKPIYRKVVTVDLSSEHSTNYYVAHNISNISMITKLDGVLMRSNDAGYISVSSYSATSYRISVVATTTNLNIQNVGYVGTGYYILEYTKT